jgi:hypothetical protein
VSDDNRTPDPVSDEHAEPAVSPADPAPDTPAAPAGPYGVGPFSLREVVLGGIWLVAFVVSFFPVYGVVGNGISVWTSGIDWVLTIAVPTVAVFLIALRRLSPSGIRRVGSLGIDQFASVAFSVSTVVWLGVLWNAFATFANSRVFVASWVAWVEFFLMFLGMLLTVLGGFIAPFDADFRGREEQPAHRYARPTRPVVPRPAPVRTPTPSPAPHQGSHPYAAASPAGQWPAASAPAATSTAAPMAGAVPNGSELYGAPSPVPASPAGDPTDPAPRDSAGDTTVLETASEPVAAPAHQAFWALAPEERVVVDEAGLPLFTIGPTAWALVIEDRGSSFVVRHEDGRTGYLHDVSGVTRG